MAWNPSPEVAVARDAAKRLGEIHGNKITHCVVLYLTDSDQLGYASFGQTREMCAEARKLGDKVYETARDHIIQEMPR